MGTSYSQCVPPAAPLTEANLPSQTGKVIIVTGGASGVGFQLCKILYNAGAKVYMAGRSEEKAATAISKIKEATAAGATPGELIFLSVHLDDLATIKPAVDRFLSLEARLDVLVNNAGVSNMDGRTAQGHDITMATNCIGPYLLTQLLLPILSATAKTAPPASVRVVWTSSLMVDLTAAKGGENIQEVLPRKVANYTTSKLGNWYLAAALARQEDAHGVLSVTLNPGNLKTDVLRHFPPSVVRMVNLTLYDARFGAYTELWAALSPDLTMADGGRYIVPWGRRHPGPREDLLNAVRTKEEGGTGQADKFAQWCEQQTQQFR